MRNRIKQWMLVGLLGMWAPLLAWGQLGAQPRNGMVDADPTRRVIPDFTLETTNGEFRLSENRGKVLVLFFSFDG